MKKVANENVDLILRDKINEIIDYINADCRGPEVTE